MLKGQMYRKAQKRNKESDWKLYKAVQNRCNNIVRDTKKSYNVDLLT